MSGSNSTFVEVLLKALKEDYSHVNLAAGMRPKKNSSLSCSIKILLDKIHSEEKYKTMLNERNWEFRDHGSIYYKNKYAVSCYKNSQLDSYSFKDRVAKIDNYLIKELKKIGKYDTPVAFRVP